MAPIEALHGSVSIDDGKLAYLRFRHPIEFSQPEIYTKERFRIEPFVFLDENNGKTDGCKFVIEPEASTSVVRFLHHNNKSEIPVSGSGFLLRYTTEGKLETYKFSQADSTHGGYEITGEDTDVSVWISNAKECPDKPFCVVQLLTPPFQPSDEKTLTTLKEKLSIPIAFWRQYHALLRGSKPIFDFTELPK